MRNQSNLRIFKTREELCRAGAEAFVELAGRAIAGKGVFTAVLSGGKTPEGIYEKLAGPYRDKVDWRKVHLFWGDERCVGPESGRSNYNMARKAMLDAVGIPQENVHRMRGEDEPKRAAALYEMEVLGFFGVKKTGPPAFDLVFLGLGEDGHTLSLFPSTPALNETNRLVVDNYVERLKEYRVTMTLGAVNGAANVIFIVSGRDKSVVLKETLSGVGGHPAALIAPRDGTLVWIVDAEAAALL